LTAWLRDEDVAASASQRLLAKALGLKVAP
jgi:hypothetical protein